MAEFGERLKQLREKKGITQQTLADQLYVTRQAVSRWECGARYPDLLTAKKIAVILDTSMDELVSGEEWKRDVEKEPLLSASMPNRVQTVLYTAALVAYLLMSIFSLGSLLPSEALEGTPAGRAGLMEIVTIFCSLGNGAALAAGLYLSIRNQLSPRKVGVIMSIDPLLRMATLAASVIEMRQIWNRSFAPGIWLALFVNLMSAAIIYLFFSGKIQWKRGSAALVYAVAVLRLMEIAQGFGVLLANYTDLGFVVRTVHSLGRIGLAALLVYQAYVLNKKRRHPEKAGEASI